MTIAENKKLVKRFYEEVVSTGKVERVPEFVAPDCVEVAEGQRHTVGIEGYIEHILGVRQTYQGFSMTVEKQIAEGEWVASCIVAKGIHEGRWLDIEPTHQPVAFTGVNVDRVVGGKIVEHGGAANLLGPLLEIGAVKTVSKKQ